MKKTSTFTVALVFLFVLGLAGGATKATASTGDDGKQKWESVLAAAKKEGTVAIYTRWTPSVRNALSQAFKKKYGINLEFSSFARGEEVAVKTEAEQRAGLHLADVYGLSNSDLLVQMKPKGFLGRIQPLLMLPEVLDTKEWSGERLPFSDKDGMAFSMGRNAARLVVYNTNLVKEGEITSVKDLLKPQYKGKITLNDPRVTGAGNALVTYLGHILWGEQETRDFLRRIIKEQEAPIQRDNRMQIETVARGKYAIALGELPSVVEEMQKAGAPIKLARCKEDNRSSAATAAFGVPTKPVHPNASMVFVNWLLTREGQSIFAAAFGQASTRLDASIEGINPDFIPVAGEKYYLSDNEDFMAAQAKWLKIAKQIIDETTK